MTSLSLISIYTAGILTLFMSIFHSRFFKLFRWEDDFKLISPVNRNIFYTIHIALLLLFYGIAALTLAYAEELSLCRNLSAGFNLMLAILWLWRALWQIFYFRPDKKSKMIAMHYILIVYFSAISFAYGLPLILKLMQLL
jgi:hypothetical protein